MALKEYTAKRSFEATPEPNDNLVEPDNKLRFVVQKHDASHLHYDFRLENKGVLVSWAVPKGPSLNPKDKRLAMQTEDHPYDYQYFEGVIPKGNYGAGQVIVWDRGHYEVEPGKSKTEQEKAFRHGLHQGKVSFILHGEKLCGEFTLVKSARQGQENAWLLIKKEDIYAAEKDITAQDKSVVSGKRVDQIEANTFNWSEWQDCIEKYELPKRDIKRPVKPMLTTLVDQPFSDSDWLYEIKWDGYRAIAEISKGQVKLYSRNQKNFKTKYPQVAQELTKLSTDLVLDGEIVMLDKAGRPDFNALQNYDPKSAGSPVYYAFDLLWLDGYDLTGAPLHLRKKFLKKVLPISDLLRYSDHIKERGEEFFRLAADQKLEGVMAKRANSSYVTGYRSKEWLKFKTIKRQETVIGGFTEPRGSRKGIGALILGVNRGGKLEYIGHSGGGISDRQLLDLRKRLEKIEQDNSPFAGKPPKPNAPVHWVKPELLCETAFSDWTPGGHMRHPKIIGIRSDKPASAVVQEKPVKKEEILSPQPNDPKNFDFTHTDKIFWPKLKLTKGDLIDYYRSEAESIMPYIKDRPVSLLRHPNGIDGQSFFQKDMNQSLPEGLQTFRRYSDSNKKDVNYLVAGSTDALLYMVQLGCIEINPWNSTIHKPDRPDWLVLDLDPEDIGFNEVIKVALAIKILLDELDVVAFPKTSGKTGIHIYLPLHARYDYEQTKQFAELLARETVKRLPKITSVERSPSKRQGKVYVDFLQNRVGQTLAAPYSVRPTAEATVSMPLEWREVKTGLQPTDFTMQNIGTRLKKTDPWKDFFNTQTDIKAALQKLEKNRDGKA
jgi:bifunctional non-homologous end joining protein LigD